MKLDTKFKRRVLASTDPTRQLEQRPSPPALVGDCEPGDVFTIEHGRVWITVLHRAKADVWAYRITDLREAYMAKTSGLTTEPAHALSTRSDDGFEPPVVPPDYQDKITRDAHQRFLAHLNGE